MATSPPASLSCDWSVRLAWWLRPLGRWNCRTGKCRNNRCRTLNYACGCNFVYVVSTLAHSWLPAFDKSTCNTQNVTLHCVSKTTPALYVLNNSAKNKPISITFDHEKIFQQIIRNSPTSPEKCCRTTLRKITHLNNLMQCCLPDSRQYTQHINRLLSEPPTYYWKRLL